MSRFASCGNPGMLMTPEARKLEVLGWASGVRLGGWFGCWVVGLCWVVWWFGGGVGWLVAVGWWMSWCEKFVI